MSWTTDTLTLTLIRLALVPPAFVGLLILIACLVVPASKVINSFDGAGGAGGTGGDFTSEYACYLRGGGTECFAK